MTLIDDCDYLLLPATPIVAHAAELPSPEGYGLFDPWCNTFLFNLTEQPAISLPCGFTQEGLPVGLQIVGKRYDDLGVLRLASLYEQTRGFDIDWSRPISARPSAQ